MIVEKIAVVISYFSRLTLQLRKRRQQFIRVHDEPPTTVAMSINAVDQSARFCALR